MKLLARLAFLAFAGLLPSLHAVPIEVTYTDAANTGFFDPAPRTPVGGNPGTTLGEQRRIAFEFAARRWSEIITGTIPIKVRASFEETGPSGEPPEPPFLATARPQGYLTNPPQGGPLPQNETVYPVALANQLTNLDVVNVGTTNDIVVECNSYFETHGANGFDERRWYYGIDADPPVAWNGFANDPDFDFVVVALHEIGHGLGFVSHLAENGSYFLGHPTVWDRLMKMSDGVTLASKTAAERASARTSNDVFIGSPNVVLYNDGNPAKVYAPSPYDPGSSMSHFDEETYSTAGSLNELMTPASSFGSQNLGPIVLNSLRDMGYLMADQQSPVVAITSPVPNKSYKSSALAVTGTARDRSAAGTSAAAGLLRVKIALSDSSARWYTWPAGGFTTTTFNHAQHAKPVDLPGLSPISTGEKTWTAALPAGLPDGFYQIHVEAVDQLDQGSGYQTSSFTIDNSAPAVVIEPWANNDTVFNLSGLRIFAPDAASVGVRISRFQVSTSQVFYWSGTNWSTTVTTLPTVANAGRWTLSVPLPSRAEIPAGQPLAVIATATDAATNVTTAQVNLTRTAADTTLPVVSVQSPPNGTQLTLPSLPALQGTAGDPESGLSSVTLTLSRFVPGGGIEFWSGSAWSATPTSLPVHHDSFNGTWTAPHGWNLPSGTSLPNGGYSIQVTATNKESPAGTTGASSTFSVDYHPTYTWTGGTMRDSNPNNDSNSWGVPENWSPYGVPDVNDYAVIANGDQVTSTVSRSVYGLKLQNGYLNFLNGPGSLGTVTTSHGSEWSGGTLYGIWVNNGSLTISSPAEHWLWYNSSLINTGTVIHSGAAIIGRENCTVANPAGATWTIAASGDLFAQYNGGNQFVSGGTLRHTAASDSEFNEWTFTLGGEVQKQGATLVVRANATLPAGTQFTGPGGFRIADGVITANGSLSNSGGAFQHSGGTIVSGTPVTFNGNHVWSGGAWQGNFTLFQGSTLAITGPTQLNHGTIFNNGGIVSWATPNPLVGRENTRINNLPGAIWRLESTGDAFANYNGGNVFNNEGKLEKVSGDTTYLRHWDYLLPGETKANNGTLFIAANWTWPAGALFSGAGTIQLAGGTVTLSGEVHSSVANLRFTGGNINGAAGAKIQGNWTWSGGSMGGTFENPVNRTLTFDGSSQLNAGTVFLNKGTVRWQGTAPVIGWEHVAVTNAAGATWEIAVSGTPFVNYNSNNSFTNYGLFTRTAPAGEVHVHSWTYHQHGVFHAAAGDTRIGSTLNLMAGCSFTGAGNFLLLDHTWLKGATTFTAPVTTHGHFHGEAAGQVHGTLRWSAGLMDGTVNVASGAILRIVSPSNRSLWYSSLIDCSGEVVWEDGGVEGRENATLRIRNGGAFRVQSAGTFYNYNFNNHVVIDDGAAFVKTSAGTSAIHWAFDNDGSAAVNAGLLSLHGGGTGDGAFSGNSGGVLRFADGPHILEGGASTTGGVEITGGSAVANGAAGGRIDVKAGTFGSVDSGVFSFAGASTWTGGILYGQTSVPSGASLATSGPDAKWVWVLSKVDVSGLLEWQGGHPIMGRENSTIDVKSGGIFRATADGDLFANYNGGNRLLLAGTFEKNGGSANTWIDEWAVEGAGIIRPVTGRFEFNTVVTLNGGTQYQGAGKTRFVGNNLNARGTATIATGATVEFAGAVINGHADGTAAFHGGSIDWSAGIVTGLVTLQSNAQISGGADKWIWAGSELRNTGTLTAGGTGWLVGRENSRLVNAATGTLTCPGTSSFGNYNGGNRLVNHGTLHVGNPHGRQTMHWTFEQSATGTLALGVGGENAVTPDFDILHVTGGIQLGGKLQVAKANAYAPAENTTFGFLAGSAISGSFATVQAPGFTVEYSAASALLRAGNSGVGYDDWVEEHELSGPDALSGADPDRDGVANFLEYAFNTDPNVHTPAPVISSVMKLGGQDWVVLKYRRWQDRIDAGIGYHPERSATLAGWDANGLTDEADPDAPVIEGSEARRCRIPVGSGENFLRMRVE